MPIDYTGPQGPNYQDQSDALKTKYIAQLKDDAERMHGNSDDPFGMHFLSDAAAADRASKGLDAKYNGPQLGGQYGAATGLAQGYGAQAADMAGHSLSDRLSSQDRPVLGQSRAQELAALEYQRKLATGEIQSPSIGQAQSGLAQAVAAQQSAAASATGGGPAMAMAQRNAANHAATINGQGQNDMRALQANEMASARDRYASGVNNLRSQDQSLWGLGQQRELGNASLNDQGVMASEGMSNQLQGAQLGADSSAYNTRLGSDIGAEMAKAAANRDLESRIIGGAATAAGAAAMSDERLKTDVKPMSGGGSMASGSYGLSGGAKATQSVSNPSASMKSTKYGPSGQAAPTDMYGHPQGYDPGQVTWAQTGMSSSDDTHAADPSFYSKNIGQPQTSPPTQPPQYQPQSSMSSAPQGLSTAMGANSYATAPQQMGNSYANRGPSTKFGGGTQMVSEGTKMPQWYQQPSAGPQLGQFMSDARVKADVHAEGYRAGVDDALSRLSTGNGTAAQRNADIDHALAGAGSQASALMPPKSRVSPAAWDRMQNIRAGNGGQAAVNAELASLARQLPAKSASPPARTIVNEGTWTPSPELAAREQFESRFPEAVGPQLGQYGEGTVNYIKNHNDYTRNQDVKNWPSDDERGLMREAALDRGAYNPEHRLISDERLKSDVSPVMKERYASTDYGQSKMRNESEHGPEKDPRRFPMIPRKLSEVMSDEKLKGQPHVEVNDVDSFLNSLRPYSYKYKDPSNEPTSSPTGGRYLGVMAQSVERGPTGDTIVKDTPRGKMLEGGALMSALAAGTGRLHERISALEAKSKAK